MKKRNDDLRLECVNWDEEQPATPDTVVECPKCGHRFRVGKKLV